MRGKGSRDERLPLPADVGEAIAAYLRDGRPGRSRAPGRCSCAPGRRIAADPGGVTRSSVAAGQRAGIGPVCAHRLRHTAATGMLRAGAPLAEIGQVLRHRRLLTTAIYAKVGTEALRALARPWPGWCGMSPLRQASPTTCGPARPGLQARPRRRSCSPSSSPTWKQPRRDDVTTEHALAWATLPAGEPSWHALPAVGGPRVRHLPAHPRPAHRGAASGPDPVAAAPGHALPVLRRGHRRADRGGRQPAVPAAGGDLPDPDRPARGHRDAGRRGDPPRPRRPRPARTAC